MKLGPVEVFYNPGDSTVLQALRSHLRSLEVRETIAKIARGEMKNYLAKLAEEAEMPFGSPEEFLHRIKNATDQ